MLHRFCDAVHGEEEGGLAQGDLLGLRGFPDVREGASDDSVESLEDLVFGPEKRFAALDPFEVRDGDAAGVGEHVRNDDDASLIQDSVALTIDRAIGSFDDPGAQTCLAHKENQGSLARAFAEWPTERLARLVGPAALSDSDLTLMATMAEFAALRRAIRDV